MIQSFQTADQIFCGEDEGEIPEDLDCIGYIPTCCVGAYYPLSVCPFKKGLVLRNFDSCHGFFYPLHALQRGDSQVIRESLAVG